MSCRVKLRRQGRMPVVHVAGALTGSDSSAVSEKVLAQSARTTHRIVVDLSEVTYIDSHGLGVLVYAWRRLQEQGRELVFLRPRPLVREILEGTNLQNVFRIVEDLTDI